MTKRNEKKKILFCNRVKLRARTAAERCRVARADAEIRRYYVVVVAAPLFCFFYKNFYFLARRSFIMTYRLGGGGTYI
jgi:hypothetical protein